MKFVINLFLIFVFLAGCGGEEFDNLEFVDDVVQEIGWDDSDGYSLPILAMSTGPIFLSNDGKSWDEISDFCFETSTFRGASYGKERIVLVGDSGVICASNDWKNWDDIGIDPGEDISSITFGHLGFALTTGKIYTSLDGYTDWQAIIIPQQNFKSITYGEGKYVAVNGNGVYYSTNLTAWNDTTPNGQSISGYDKVFYVNNLFISISNDPYSSYIYSLDGYTWNGPYRISDLPGEVSSITYGNGLYLAPSTDVSSGRTGYFYSSMLGSSNWSFSEIYSGAYIGFRKNLFISAGQFGMQYSSDGSAWEKATGGFGPMSAVNFIF